MITELAKKLEAQGSGFKWSTLSSGLRSVWFLVILVFSAGSTFAYYSGNLILRSEFDPVKSAVAGLSTVPKRLHTIERFLTHQSTCAIYQSTYIRDLADYAAKVRRKPPVMTEAYSDCLSKAPDLGS